MASGVTDDLSDAERQRITSAVEHFEKSRHKFEIVARDLVNCFSGDTTLGDMIHFIKYRVKKPQSLSEKLARLARVQEAAPIDQTNLFKRIHDLAGVRIIHLHTDEIVRMHPQILKILKENSYSVIGTVAHCWDVEYEELFRQIDLPTEKQSSMYTTVHYDVLANRGTGIACELQVRSLADEVWGEVSHRVNYPEESPSEACRDQLKVLARLTSGCGRLVDSIFKTHQEAPRSSAAP